MGTRDTTRVGIAGITGYGGVELARILARHPRVEIAYLAGHSRVGEPVERALPSLRGIVAGDIGPLAAEPIADAGVELMFLALPHGASMDVAGPLLERDIAVVDLAADFRFDDLERYAEWYGEHRAAALVERAVYGLPELFRADLPGARFIAVPGCYPTAALLSLAPLVRAGWIDASDLIVDAKSGASGAGRAPAVGTMLAEAGESVRPYKVASHRHTPEIEEKLGRLGSAPARVTFTPHLVPMSRGILSAAYARPIGEHDGAAVQALFEESYAGEPFVRVLPPDVLPETVHVRGSNYVDVAVRVDARSGGRILAFAAIDNLVKGAAGQAVQAMNVALGYDETLGLLTPPTFP